MPRCDGIVFFLSTLRTPSIFLPRSRINSQCHINFVLQALQILNFVLINDSDVAKTVMKDLRQTTSPHYCQSPSPCFSSHCGSSEAVCSYFYKLQTRVYEDTEGTCLVILFDYKVFLTLFLQIKLIHPEIPKYCQKTSTGGVPYI